VRKLEKKHLARRLLWLTFDHWNR